MAVGKSAFPDFMALHAKRCVEAVEARRLKKGNEMQPRIELGSRVKDIVNGFEGTVVGRCEWLTGCVQYVISPKVDKDGKRIESEWVDEMRLQVLEAPPEQIAQARAQRAAQANPNPGGPQDVPAHKP